MTTAMVVAQASTGEMLLRLAISLGIVLGLLWALARIVQARGARWGLTTRVGSSRGGGSTPRHEVEVVTRQGLAKGVSMSLVRVGDQRLLLGVTESRVSVLATLDGANGASPTGPAITEVGATSAPTTAGLAGADLGGRLRQLDLERSSAGTGDAQRADVGDAPSNAAWWRLSRSGAPRTAPETSTRMSLAEALRELTLRRN